MIYEVYWSACYSVWAKTEEERKCSNALARGIKNSNPEDKFIFILSRSQQPHFETWLNSHEGLKDLISYKVPYLVTNSIHPDFGRVLQLVVMGKEKLKEGVEYGTARNCTGKT